MLVSFGVVVFALLHVYHGCAVQMVPHMKEKAAERLKHVSIDFGQTVVHIFSLRSLLCLGRYVLEI